MRDQVEGRLKAVLAETSMERRESPSAVAKLEKQTKAHGKEHVVEQAAYVWFNRFCALRFMDVNRYNRVGVLSPQPGQFQPEILAEAKAGHIDQTIVSKEIADKVYALLDGSMQMEDAQNEAYRLLIVAVSNQWNQAMPFLFEKIADYTELLMPEDLLSNKSILAYTREALTPDACVDVEVLGWLYQFYISEKKDEVFAGLKKNKKITPDNIPAATQLFTPHWIVRYLVENSLGRLWMLNRPGSKLIDQMDYYIKPEQAETDFLKVSSPEEIKICDPACGSGHMLTYAFDLLYAIYEEEGYEPGEIPEKILTNNLYGIEIDERAGELAAFALSMKARSKQRRFLNKRVCPNIKVLENVVFDEGELAGYMDEVGSDLFTAPLLATLKQFDEVDNFGSLITPKATDVAELKRLLDEKDMRGNLLLHGTHQKVLKALDMADYLIPKYYVVIANPPYMGSGGMNGRLAAWAKEFYPDSKSDLFAMFIERGLQMVPKLGYSAMVTMQSWMFLSSYEKLRSRLMVETSIESMAHMANMVMGIAFGTSATVWKRGGKTDSKGAFCFVEYGDIADTGYPIEFPPHNARNAFAMKDQGDGFFRVSSVDLKVIPDSPIAYWISRALRRAFQEFPQFSEYSETRIGLITGDNDHYIRQWQEISVDEAGFNLSREEAACSGKKWFPQSKGGEFRRWYGNHHTFVNWQNDGHELQTRMHTSGKRILAHNFNLDKIFLPGITWTKITSGTFGVRSQPKGFIFNDASANAFPLDSDNHLQLLAFLCSKLPIEILKAMNPTLNFLPGNVLSLPVAPDVIDNGNVGVNAQALISISKDDWDSYETSWEFSGHPLLHYLSDNSSLEESYEALSMHWSGVTLEMQRLEEENNRIFIDAYGLQDELEHEVPLNEVTLMCNPPYCYGGNKSGEELDELLLTDTMKEFLSYAVGCMFGRYSLDKHGLILASAGDTLEDYLSKVDMPLEALQFEPDDDNVIPILEGDWFADDIAERFRKFLRVTFGDENYEENLRFIEEAIGKPVEKYFLKDFYTDHVKRYKKRPIYWLFSSPGGSFNALIYMHRYRPDTVSIVLNDYLREFREKLTAKLDHQQTISISGSSSQAEKNKAQREITKLKKALDDVNEYEKEILFPLATEQIPIDLDDGVKVNYPRFGKALKKITGLSEK